MPVQVGWLLAERIVLVKSWDFFSLEEMNTITTPFGLAALNKATQPLHILHDASELTGNAPIAQMAKANAPIMSHPQIGWWLTYGDKNAYKTTVAHVLLGLFRIRSRFFDSQAEALAFLQDVDSSLPDLQAYLAQN